jgi:DNA-binding response OmpR family regulator
MDVSRGTIWFFGDLSDPWVVSIAGALPAGRTLTLFDGAAELPTGAAEASQAPRLIVIHRQRLLPGDAERLKEWKAQASSETAPALILCVGPYVRYEELERFSGLVDLVLSEATACDVLHRHATRLLEGRSIRTPLADAVSARVLIASANGELCRTIAEACAAAGFQVEQAGDQAIGALVRNTTDQMSPPETLLTVWDVPVLEAWTDRLERHARMHGPVVALIGFADRYTVALAKSKGAFACLDLPLNMDDLIEVIDRCARTLSRQGPALPGRVEPPHILPPRSRRRNAGKTASAQVVEWPPQTRPPTIASSESNGPLATDN